MRVLVLGLLTSVPALISGDLVPDCMAATTKDSAAPAANVSWKSMTYRDLLGGTHGLESLGAKTVIVDLWATWCPSCASIMPVYEQWLKEWPEVLAIVAISQDASEEAVQTYVKQHNVRLPVWLDPKMTTSQAVQTVKLPTAILLRAGDSGWETIEVFAGGDPRTIARLKKAVEDRLGPPQASHNLTTSEKMNKDGNHEIREHTHEPTQEHHH